MAMPGPRHLQQPTINHIRNKKGEPQARRAPCGGRRSPKVLLQPVKLELRHGLVNRHNLLAAEQGAAWGSVRSAAAHIPAPEAFAPRCC